VGSAATSWEAGGLHVHRCGGCVLSAFENRGLALAVWELKKDKRLPSHLEGPGFWPGAMAEDRVWPLRPRGGGRVVARREYR